MKKTDKIRLKIASKILKKYIEQGAISSNIYDNNECKYTELSIKLADELINKINSTSTSTKIEHKVNNSNSHYQKAVKDVIDLLLVENDDDEQSLLLSELSQHIELTKRKEYLKYLNNLLLDQLLNNITNIGPEGEKKCLNLRKLIVNKFLPIYA